MKNEKIYYFLISLFFIASFAIPVKADMIIPYDFSYPVNIFISLVINIVIEIFFGYLIFFNKLNQKIKGIKITIFGNIITTPLLYFYMSLFSATKAAMLINIIFIEAVIILIEAFLYWTFLKSEISFKKSIKISFILNIFSFVLGFILLFIIRILFGIMMKIKYINSNF